MQITKKTVFSIVPLLFTFILAFNYIFDAKIDLNGDNLEYFTYAKAILKGGYTNLMSPSNYYTNNFPPGYPLMLAPVMMFTKSIVALKIFNGLLFLAGILLLAHTLNKADDKKIIPIITFGVISLFNPDVLDFATMLMSEMAYILFIALAAFCLYKSDDEKSPFKDIYFWLMIASAGYAYHIRSAAVAIIGGIMLHYLFKKKWTHLGLSVGGFIVCLLPWMIRNKIRGVGSSRYFSQMTQINAWDKNAGTLDTQGMLQRFWDNFCSVITQQVPDALFSREVDYTASATFSQWIFGIAIIGLIFYGLFNIKKLNFFFIGVVIATGATLLPWNGGGGTRYLTSIIPVLYLGLVFGVYHLAARFTKSSIVPQGITILGAIVIFTLVKPNLDMLHQIATTDHHPAYKNYFEIAKIVKDKTPKNTYICCRKPALFYFYADRNVSKYTFSPDDKVMIQHMYKAKFSYVILEQLGYGSTPKYLYPTIKKNPEIFKVVMHLKNPDTYLFQFDREAAAKKLNIQ